MEDIAELQPG